jgi:ABC-2 type transport system ATP-binding protein
MNHTPYAIQTSGLSKTYRQGPPALDNLSLSVNRGEIFGYLGPNGAGKTTTIRLLLDLIRPTAGSARLLGLDAHQDSVALHRRIGFVPGELNLWENLTARQAIAYLARLRGGVDMRYVGELAERLKFDMSKKIRSYSTGNKRKIGLILALMHKPELLILDEPTSGLDPLMQQTVNELMREAQAAGATVFLSSHMLSEVQAICERVAILREGRLQAVERVADLTRVNFYWVNVRLAGQTTAAEWLAVPNVVEAALTNGHSAPHQAGQTEVKIKLHGEFDPLLRQLARHHVISLKTTEPTLEEIFLSFYSGAGQNQGAQHETAKAGVQ